MTESSPTDKASPSISTGSSDQQRGRKEKKEKKSFANTLRKRFSRSKKRRSQSADRATMRAQEHLLKPPEQRAHTTGEDDMGKGLPPPGSLRKSRSQSFSSSLRKLFRRKKKGGEFESSRESSISRASTRSRQEEGVATAYREEPYQPGDLRVDEGYPAGGLRPEEPYHAGTLPREEYPPMQYRDEEPVMYRGDTPLQDPHRGMYYQEESGHSREHSFTPSDSYPYSSSMPQHTTSYLRD